MVEELEQETQQDPIPPLPKGYKMAKSNGAMPPLPAGYSLKKKGNGNSQLQSNGEDGVKNNPFAIGGQYNSQKPDFEKLDLSNTKHDAAIAEQIKNTPLRKIPLTPILDNTYRQKPITEIDIKEGLERTKQHKIDMETAIDNTTLKVLKNKGIVAGKGSPLYETERKKIEEKTKPTMIGGIVINGAEATFHKDKDGNIGLDRNLGFFEGMRKSFNDAIDAEDEANAFSNMTTEQRVEYANKQMQGNPNPEYMEERNSGVGSLIGGAGHYLLQAAAAGTLATTAVIAAPETAGASLTGLAPALTVLFTAPDMIKQGAKDEIMTMYMQLKQNNPNADDRELMRIAESGDISGGLLGAANALAYTTTLKLPLLDGSKNVLKKYLNGVASSAVHLGGITAGSKAAQLAERKIEGYHVGTDDAIKEITETFVEGAKAGAVLNGLMSGAHILPKAVKSAMKWVITKQVPVSEVATVLKANVDAGRIPPEVAEQTMADIDGYKKALDKTADGLKPETQASVAGLIQAKDNLIAEMATKDETQREPYQQKIDALNKQIEKITKSNDPFKYEVDEVTGNKIAEPPKEELPDLSVPIEGTDKKGVPIGEDVPPETKPTDVKNEKIEASPGLSRGDVANKAVDKSGEPIEMYHGSGTSKDFEEFNNNSFFTPNDYIAENYAENQGGKVYKRYIYTQNPLEISEDKSRMSRGDSGMLMAGTDSNIIDLLSKLYSKDAVDLYKQYGLTKGLGNIVQGNFEPLIKYAKENGHDSIKFKDVSFDQLMTDDTYLVFDPKNVSKDKNVIKSKSEPQAPSLSPNIEPKGDGGLSRGDVEGVVLPKLKDVETTSRTKMDGTIETKYKIGDVNAVVLDYGEPMGVEGMPSWAKKEHYVENLWRDKQNEKSKGHGLVVILKILKNAKEQGADIVTGKRREDSGQRLHDYYKELGFKDIGAEEPLGVYIDLRTNKPIEHIEKLIADKKDKSLSPNIEPKPTDVVGSEKSKYVDVYKHQDENAERIISERQWNNNAWRYKLENAGDVLRELAKYNNQFLDPSYIYEKIDKIDNYIKKIISDSFNKDREDFLPMLADKDIKNATDLRKAYEEQPVMSEAQEQARQLALNMIDGKYKEAQKQIEYFNSLRNNKEGGAKENLMKANEYRESIFENKPILNEGEAKTEIPIAKEEGSITEVKSGEVIPETKAGEKEPPKPPKEPIEETGGKERLNDKGILNHLVSAENVPEASKKGFEEKGLKYNTSSQKEAESVAKSVIDKYGVEDAVLLAEAQKFDGDVNSLIYAETLNRLAKSEAEAKTQEEKIEFAKKFAEVGIKYDEAGRKGGRFSSAINYFYKKSPLGVQMIENAKRKEAFEEWSKPKDKSWKEFFDEMMKEPEFEAIFKEKVSEQTREERATTRQKRRQKIVSIFDKAKIGNKGTGSYIVPPQIWDGAVEIMKQAALAGETVYEIVDRGVLYIKSQYKEKWDEDKFKADWAERLVEMGDDLPKSKVDVRKERLKKEIDNLKSQILLKTRFKKNKNEPVTDKEIESLENQKKELTEELDKIVPVETERWYQDRMKTLEKFRKKLKGLTDKEKEEVVRKSFQKIVESGGLDYADFKKIIADITGRGELTESETARLKQLVKEINLVDEAGEKARTERTQEARENYFEAQTKAAKASRELNELLYNRPNITKRLTSIMQLNTLGIPALVNNPIYNIWNQTTLRLPVGVVKTIIDQAIKYGSGGKIAPETNIISATTQAEFFSKLGLGTKESLQQFFTGLNRADYTAKEIQGQQIRPATAIRDLWKFFKGEKNLTTEQQIDKTLQATVGIPAEIVARTLNLGDKPQRFAAEGAQAAAFAKALGLKDIDYDLFIDFPREEAYRAYKAKGLSDADAAKKADYIKDTIIKEGQRSTFQQDNMLTDVINRAFGGEQSGVGSLAKAIAISPYIKIPSNAYWSYYNLINPEVAFLQSMIYGAKAYAKKSGKYTRFLGDKYNTSAAKDLNEAKYWFAHGAVGMATRAVVVAMVGAGIVRPSNNQDDTKKEREGEQNYEQQGTINVSKLWAAVHGRNPDDVKNGLLVGNRWFGHFGTMSDAVARKEEEMTPEQREQQKYFWETTFGGMEIDALKDLNQGVFGNTSSLLTAIERKDFQNYGVNLINMFTNIVQPAALAQMERAAMPYYTKQKADTFLGELNNTMLSRSKLYRDLTNQYPPSKIGIWGDKVEKKDNLGMRLFGISRANPDNFAQPIYEDYKRTNNTKFFPPAVMPVIEDNGKRISLPTKDAARLEELVGQQRKNLISPYVNDMATFEGSKETYSQLKDDDAKLDKLRIIYEEGYNNGKALFLKEHPEYIIPEKTKEQKREDKKDSRSNKIFRKALKNKTANY